ncbi:hypothetical protein [Aureispira anguillae]|uniref:Uncharacterized protein n=1 Tax=Aureispira anguillae TaxID=2864201 RepID=A0A915YK58_9BACT|nr:hypothetical protein [Aureispira anguillae]BDS14298.1 hypothetical protein AsAng_0050770 [Aureispira anguillae]
MNYKQKYQALLGGIVLFVVLAYFLAFGKTWTAYRTTTQLEQRLSNAAQAWKDIETYQHQLNQLSKEQNNQHFTPNNLFQKVTGFCQENKLGIKGMSEPTVYQQEDMVILQNAIRVEGTFIPMVELLYTLEQKEQLGRVVSAEFELTKNYQSRKKELIGTIYLQNIQHQSSKTTNHLN